MSLRPARRPVRRQLAAWLILTALAAPLTAQWTSDPALNLAVGDGASDQTQSKLQPADAGAMFLSWFDGIGSGYDVRLQFLDGGGDETLGDNGVLVADRGFSSTQDYGLALSSSGDALLAFRDDRFTGTQITAAKVTSGGALSWGANGVQLTNTASFVAAPKIAGVLSGAAVVAWTQDQTVRLRKLDNNGVPQWGSDVVLTPPSGSYSVADLHASGNDVILSFVHQTGGFGSPRQLRAQKFDTNGNPLWGAGPVAVFDSGSLQFGNFPSFLPDGLGGAIFSWYDAGSLQLQCYVQRLDGSGAELFAHNGVAVSTNATRVRVSPHVTYDPNTGHTVASWVEQSSNQAQSGVYAQKLDGAGARLWGDEGVGLVPVSSTQVGNVRCLTSADTSMVFWIEQQSFGDDRVRCFRVFSDGQSAAGPFEVASTASAKSRLAAASTKFGQSVLAWNDERTDSSDVYAQNVLCDGSLGIPSPTAAWTDLGNALAGTSGLPTLVGDGSLCPGSPFTITLDNARPLSPIAVVLGFDLLGAPLKGGVLVPTPDQIFFNLNSNGAGSLNIGTLWPSYLPAGFELYIQIWVTDPAGVSGFAATNGLLATVP